MNRVAWEYYDKFDKLTEKYLPNCGEGETKTTQIVTAINKLIYKWYNDGDVFDNTMYLTGWANDLSDYANWLAENVEGAKEILDKVFNAKNDDDYEQLLKELADKFLTEEFLEINNNIEKVGTIYDCAGEYEFKEYYEDEDEDYE